MRWRDLLFAGPVALTVGLGLSHPAFKGLDGLSIDVLFWLRHKVFGPAHKPEDSAVAVIALDEETYRTPPFADTPNALWGRELALVLGAVIDGGAKVVGFDVIFPTSVERFLPGFDREFLVALRNAARAGKVVLGKVQHQQLPIRPFPGQSFAVGHQQNIRSLNLFRDDDEVIRRVPLTFESDEATGGQRIETAMALELAARALGVRPEIGPDGMALGGTRIPGSHANAMVVNFEAGSDDIPTYSLADLHACARGRNAEFFRRHFEGKVVLIGVVLDVEDRKITSKRLITGVEGAAAERRCGGPPMAGLFRGEGFVRDSIPGVYVHATAVNNLLRGEALAELPPRVRRSVSLALVLAAAGATMAFAPLAASLALAAGAALWIAAATLAFRLGLVLPLTDPILGAGLAFAVLEGYRFAVADRDKRLLRRSFSLYLAPAVVDRLIATDKPPALGGELRTLSMWFSDIERFTALSETLAPADLVALMNEYFSAMTEIVEAHGGFVDKYVGDGIIAVFGAPHDDPGHALHAVRAALACRERLADLNRDAASLKGGRLAMRIGINTGEALVGNIGSRRRFNYTVMGDAVNLASRLEGVNKIYGTTLLVADSTTAACGPDMAWREIDAVRVKGRDRPVGIAEPLGEADAIAAQVRAISETYAAGLAAYRARRFADAASAFAAIADRDPPSRVFLERARALALAPPPADWEPVTTLDTK
ncbi:MAG: CHASE2 domain-containing protein [Pseudomonadota bacterium]